MNWKNIAKFCEFSNINREITANLSNFTTNLPRIYCEFRHFQNSRYRQIRHYLPRLNKAFGGRYWSTLIHQFLYFKPLISVDDLLYNTKKITLKGYHNKFVNATNDGCRNDNCTPSAACNVQVEVIKGNCIALKSCHGKYLSGERNLWHFLSQVNFNPQIILLFWYFIFRTKY